MTTDIIDVLKGLLSEDETIYEIVRCAASPVYIIGPVVDDIERKLDLGGCIENVQHHLNCILKRNQSSFTGVFSVASSAFFDDGAVSVKPFELTETSIAINHPHVEEVRGESKCWKLFQKSFLFYINMSFSLRYMCSKSYS